MLPAATKRGREAFDNRAARAVPAAASEERSFMNIRKLAQAMALSSMVGVTMIVPTYAADGDKMQSFDTWANQTAAQYGGRIPRHVYIDEMGRRWELAPNRYGTRTVYIDQLGRQWDLLDVDGRGLTPVEASRLTGNVDSSAGGPPLTGSEAQPGNMGPGSAKGQ
jgi:hypothetical protein